jgi:hypothetical protein
MSGILDNKSRVLDAMITIEGRRQLAAGDLRIEHVSFTDTGTRYAADLVSGSADATTRIFLEACHLPQDQITFEADDSGRLKSFRNEDGIQVKDGQILSYSFTTPTSLIVTGALENTRILKGDEFASTSETLLASSLENFKKLQLIATHDRVFEDDGFGLGTNSIEFMINNQRPIPNVGQFVAHLSQIESLFSDARLSNVQNFKYLPPINKVGETQAVQPLGNYKPLGRSTLKPLSYDQIKHELGFYEQQGYCRSINIDPTSRDNRIVGQFFEKMYNQLTKLDVIDYGRLRTGNPDAPIAHIFFVGRLMVDDNNTDTFIHIFTLIFE